MPSYIMAATQDHPDAAPWARRRDFICGAREVQKGRVNTFVQLYKAVAQEAVREYPMHTNTWFYIQMPGAEESSDFKAVSYRYATYRTTSLLEPLQDDAHGSCRDQLSAAAVAQYVDTNAVALAAAVEAQRADAATSTESAAASVVGVGVEDRSVHILTVAVACLVAVGVLHVRTARAASLAVL